MAKRVLNVGQCGPDHASISQMLNEHFDVEIVRTHLAADTLEALKDRSFDLVLVNRKLDQDYSDGMLIIQQILSDEEMSQTPVMLVSNYPEYQQQAVSIGAAYGFGKAELRDQATIDRIREILG